MNIFTEVTTSSGITEKIWILTDQLEKSDIQAIFLTLSRISLYNLQHVRI